MNLKTEMRAGAELRQPQGRCFRCQTQSSAIAMSPHLPPAVYASLRLSTIDPQLPF